MVGMLGFVRSGSFKSLQSSALPFVDVRRARRGGAITKIAKSADADGPPRAEAYCVN
jgi:hypothetical protein